MSNKSLILVLIQFLAFVFFSLDGFLRWDTWLLIPQVFAFVLALWGVIIMRNFNIQPEVKERAKMITKGPYRIIRNPMYAGIIIFFGVSVIGEFSFLRLSVYLVLVVILVMKIFMEEVFLTERFKQVYLRYKQKTFRLFPYLF